MEAASIARGGAPAGIDVGALERTIRSSLRRVGGRSLSREDHEELVQEGWVAYYAALERGAEVDNPGGFITTAAVRAGVDRLRRSGRVEAVEDSLLAAVPSRAPNVDDAVCDSLDAELCRKIARTLKPEEQRVFRLRFDPELELRPREIQELLQITRPRYNKLIARALERVGQAVADVREGRWHERLGELLVACETGTATEAERAQARELLRDDPLARATLKQLRQTLPRVSAFVPVPVIAAPGAVLGTLSAELRSLRDGLGDLAHRIGVRLNPAFGGPASENAVVAAVGSHRAAAAVVALAIGGGAAGGFLGVSPGDLERAVRDAVAGVGQRLLPSEDAVDGAAPSAGASLVNAALGAQAPAATQEVGHGAGDATAGVRGSSPGGTADDRKGEAPGSDGSSDGRVGGPGAPSLGAGPRESLDGVGLDPPRTEIGSSAGGDVPSRPSGPESGGDGAPLDVDAPTAPSAPSSPVGVHAPVQGPPAPQTPDPRPPRAPTVDPQSPSVSPPAPPPVPGELGAVDPPGPSAGPRLPTVPR